MGKKASLLNKRNPTNANAQKLKKAKKEQTNTYQKEQLEYIRGQIDKIRNSIEDRQSQSAWQKVNKASGRKNTLRAKLKAVSKERLPKWKEYYKNLLRNPPEITEKPIQKLSMANETSN